MEITTDRIGKLAMLAAMTSREEEEKLKEFVLKNYPQFKMAVTFISGTKNRITETITKSAVGCALQNEIVRSYREIRDAASKRQFGRPYSKCSVEQREQLQEKYPQRVQEVY